MSEQQSLKEGDKVRSKGGLFGTVIKQYRNEVWVEGVIKTYIYPAADLVKEAWRAEVGKSAIQRASGRLVYVVAIDGKWAWVRTPSGLSNFTLNMDELDDPGEV